MHLKTCFDNCGLDTFLDSELSGAVVAMKSFYNDFPDLPPDQMKTVIDTLASRSFRFKLFVKAPLGVSLMAQLETCRAEKIQSEASAKLLLELEVPPITPDTEMVALMPPEAWTDSTKADRFTWVKGKRWASLAARLRAIVKGAPASFEAAHAEKLQSIAQSQRTQFTVASLGKQGATPLNHCHL